MRHKLADYFVINQLTEDVAGEGPTENIPRNEPAKDQADRQSVSDYSEVGILCIHNTSNFVWFVSCINPMEHTATYCTIQMYVVKLIVDVGETNQGHNRVLSL